MAKMTLEEQRKELEKIKEEISELWKERGKDYGDVLHELKLKGQFSNLHRKYARLKKLIWENEPEDYNYPLIEEEAMDAASYAMFIILQVRYLTGKIENNRRE